MPHCAKTRFSCAAKKVAMAMCKFKSGRIKIKTEGRHIPKKCTDAVVMPFFILELFFFSVDLKI